VEVIRLIWLEGKKKMTRIPITWITAKKKGLPEQNLPLDESQE
jgi:hypothetical protein